MGRFDSKYLSQIHHGYGNSMFLRESSESFNPHQRVCDGAGGVVKYACANKESANKRTDRLRLRLSRSVILTILTVLFFFSANLSFSSVLSNISRSVAEISPTTEPTLSSEVKQAQKSKSNLSEMRGSTNGKTVKTKLAETKLVAQTKLESTLAEEIAQPAAVPVVTPEEAQKTNAEAIVFAGMRERLMVFTRKGMDIVYDDKMNKHSTVSIAESFDRVFQKNGVKKTRDELSAKHIPKSWAIDYNSLRGTCDFGEQENGYRLYSPDGFLKIKAPLHKVSNTTLGVSIEISSNTEDTHVKIGFEEQGLIHPGTYQQKELSGKHQEEIINFEISALDHFDLIRPYFEIQGDVTIHSLRYYQKTISGTTVLEGEVLERSELPAPEESDYPNCRFTAHFKGEFIKSGDATPQEMAFIIEGFENYRLLGTDKLKNGDKVECVIIPFEKLSEDDQETQQADDLNLFLLTDYYVLSFSIQKKEVSSENESIPLSNIPFLDEKKEYSSIFDLNINPPLPAEIDDAQHVAIQNDLEKMNTLLHEFDDSRIEKVNQSFQIAWEKEKRKDPLNYNRIGRYVWRNVDNSFWCLPEQYTFLEKPDTLSKETLDCFAALKNACESNGVHLIISLVPDLYVISSRVMNKEFKNIPDIQTATYVKQLSEIGIETIYSSDTIIQQYNRFKFAFFFPSNPHPCDTAQDINSDILAERIKRYNLKQDLDDSLFSIIQSPHSYKDDEKYLFPSQCDIGNNIEKTAFTCREVLYDNKKMDKNKDSFILVIGNSYIGSPISPPEAFPILLSYKILSTVDWYRISGYGPFSDILVQFISRPSFFLKNKKVVIFHFGTETLKRVNKLGTMVNIEQLDMDNIVYNNRTMKLSYTLSSNSPVMELQDIESWNSLPNKTVFRIDDNNKLKHTVQINNLNNETKSSSILCVIPAVCYPVVTWDGPQGEEAYLIVNGIKKRIPSFNYSAHYFNLPFELPGDTKELSISFDGAPGALIAIKDIQIWQ